MAKRAGHIAAAVHQTSVAHTLEGRAGGVRQQVLGALAHTMAAEGVTPDLQTQLKALLAGAENRIGLPSCRPLIQLARSENKKVAGYASLHRGTVEGKLAPGTHVKVINAGIGIKDQMGIVVGGNNPYQVQLSSGKSASVARISLEVVPVLEAAHGAHEIP